MTTSNTNESLKFIPGSINVTQNKKLSNKVFKKKKITNAERSKNRDKNRFDNYIDLINNAAYQRGRLQHGNRSNRILQEHLTEPFLDLLYKGERTLTFEQKIPDSFGGKGFRVDATIGTDIAVLFKAPRQSIGKNTINNSGAELQEAYRLHNSDTTKVFINIVPSMTYNVSKNGKKFRREYFNMQKVQLIYDDYKYGRGLSKKLSNNIEFYTLIYHTNQNYLNLIKYKDKYTGPIDFITHIEFKREKEFIKRINGDKKSDLRNLLSNYVKFE